MGNTSDSSLSLLQAQVKRQQTAGGGMVLVGASNRDVAAAIANPTMKLQEVTAEAPWS
jgi:hypothetical protein